MNSVEPSLGSVEGLARELRNFEDIAREIVPRPGSIPSLGGFEVYRKTPADGEWAS